MRKPFAKSIAPLQVGLLVAVVTATQFHGAALAQDVNAESGSMRSTLQALTGSPRDPVVTITTPALGMTGWRRDPLAITTPALGMTGWRRDSTITITTRTLGMTGWQRDPVSITTRALGMTGWAAAPEPCNPPFAGDACVAAAAGPRPALADDLGAGAEALEEQIERSLLALFESARPLPAPPFDLGVAQKGSDVCEPGRRCTFDVVVGNVGRGPFQGPLFVDLTGAQVAKSSSGWICVAGACVRPDGALAPGESETLTLTVLVPAGAQQQCAALKVPEPGDAPVRFVQLMLAAAGIDAGPPDNQMGRKTRSAIETFRRTARLPSGSEIDEPLLAALKDLMPHDRRPENDRDCIETGIAR